MKMSTQIQDNKNIRKSSEELIKEAETIMGKTASVYIPQICAAVQAENPNLNLIQIQENVIYRCRNIWTKGTIQHSWGEFVRSYQKSGKYSKTSNLKKQEQSNQINQTFAKIPEPKPVEEQYTIITEEQEDDDDEELEQELQAAGYGEFGDTGKTLKELEGDFYESTSDLFRMLTQKDISDDSDQDFLVEYLRPTREFRKGLALELTERKRTIFYNRAHSIIELLEDFMHCIDEANKK